MAWQWALLAAVLRAAETRSANVGSRRAAWEALHAAAPGSELHGVACGHNDCPRPTPLLLRFLARHGMLEPDTALER